MTDGQKTHLKISLPGKRACFWGAPAHAVTTLLWTSLLPPWEEHPRIGAEASADVVLDVSPWAGKKEAALRAHRTQHLSIDRHFLSRPNLKALLGVETWRRAWPSVAGVRADPPF